MTRMPQRVLIGLATVLLWAATPAVARDQLIIGTTQFPSTLHPSIDSMLAKSYVLGLTQRPFTTYDQNWELVCLLCTELPTIENGKAKIEDLPPGFKRDPGTTFCKSADPALATKGMAVTYTIQPNATWGDGTPVTTDDVMFTYEVGKNEKLQFAIQNTGTSAASISSINLVAASTSFALDQPPAQPFNLDAGATATFAVIFTPGATGSLTATLRINNSSFTLSGSGTQPAALPTYPFQTPTGTCNRRNSLR
jgi:ABC-type transport system substrate-binding protein